MYAVVDCNNFFASCERVFRPELRTKPVVVLSNNDGCIVSRSAEAKALGIKMAVPYFEVKDLLQKNNVHVFSSNYILYGDFSGRVMNALAEFVDREDDLEVYSIDEAFLNLAPLMEYKEPVEYCKNIKEKVEQWTGIPVSIGIAPTKTLSKLANDIAKKHRGYKGVFYLDTKERTEKVLEASPVRNVWGIGYKLSYRLTEYGIANALQLRDADEGWIRKKFGITVLRTIHELRGTPCFHDGSVPTVRKHIASTRSFGRNVTSIEDLREAIATYVSWAAVKLRKQKSATCGLYIFLQTNKSQYRPQQHEGIYRELPVATDSTPELIRHATDMLQGLFREGSIYKKAGVMFSQIVPRESVQLNVFDTIDRTKFSKLMNVLDVVNLRDGQGMLKFAATGTTQNWMMRSGMRSPQYTTKWGDILEIGKQGTDYK
jgi:DNA polymerase V